MSNIPVIIGISARSPFNTLDSSIRLSREIIHKKYETRRRRWVVVVIINYQHLQQKQRQELLASAQTTATTTTTTIIITTGTSNNNGNNDMPYFVGCYNITMMMMMMLTMYVPVGRIEYFKTYIAACGEKRFGVGAKTCRDIFRLWFVVR